MILKALLLLLTGLAILWRRSTDDRLHWSVLWVLASVFISRVYWLTPWGTLRAERLACLALLLHYTIDLLRKQQWPRFKLLPLLLLAMLPWMVLGSWLASPVPAASLRKTLIYFPYLAGFAALCHFLDNRERLAAAWDFLIKFGAGMAAFSLAGYFLFFAGIDLGLVRVEYGIVWLRGSMTNPNVFGAAAGMVLIATLVRLLTSHASLAKRSLIDLGTLAVAAAALVVSFSRAPWALSILAASAAFLFTRRHRHNRFAAFSVLLATVLLTSMAASAVSTSYSARLKLDPGLRPATAGEFGELVLDNFWNSYRNAYTPIDTPFRARLQNSSVTVHWRFAVSSQALRDWLKSPIIGRGTESLMLSNPGKPKVYIPVTGVAILHDWGIAAFALYAAFLLLAACRLWTRLRLPSPERDLFLGIFLVFLFQVLQTQVTTTLPLASFWVLAAVFAAAAELPPGRPGKTSGPDDRPGGS